MSPCPPASLLERLLNGQLDEVEYQSAETHLEACETCRSLLEGLIDDPEVREWRSRSDLLFPPVSGLTPIADRKPPEVSGPCPATPESRRLPPDGIGPDTRERPPRYRILRFLAEGNIGEVHMAEDRELSREVALKQLQLHRTTHKASRDRFLLEAKVTGSLEHPGIVPVYSLGTGPDGQPVYTMRLIRGESFKEAIRKLHAGGSNYTLRGLLTRFHSACQTVAYAHSRGVLHRDLKPSNIMLGPFDETLVVDWGMAKYMGDDPDDQAADAPARQHPWGQEFLGTRDGQIIGTPAYMSPEQAAGRLDDLGPASDVYSLGASTFRTAHE